MSDTASTASTDAPATEQSEPHGSDAGEQNEAPTLESLEAKLAEITAHSRKWEDRAKENKAAADELAALKRERMTDSEKADADRVDMEKRVSDAEDRAVNAENALARYKVAIEFGLEEKDAEALASVKDEAALRALAERLAPRSGQTPNPAQGRRTSAAPTSAAEKFAAAFEGLL